MYTVVSLLSVYYNVQVFIRLNHLNITISYSAVVSAISKLNEVPINKWIASKQTFKFVGDNVDVSMGVRDIS